MHHFDGAALLFPEEIEKKTAINNSIPGLLCLTQDLGNTKTTQTLGCYVCPRNWVMQILPKY